jgi:hypothetical protein
MLLTRKKRQFFQDFMVDFKLRLRLRLGVEVRIRSQGKD